MGMTPIDNWLTNSPTAPYPAQGFPAQAAFGPPVSPSGSGGPALPTGKPADPTQRTHIMIWVAAFVIVGYVLWHHSFTR